MFLGYQHLFTGEIDEGKRLLQKIAHRPFDWAIYQETTPEDYLQGKIDPEGIKTIFLPVDETRESILKKQKQLQIILEKYPEFRDGLLQLAITYMQLGRSKEALEILTHYHGIDPNNPTVEYYLSILCTERFRYKQAWEHLKSVETLLSLKDHHPDFLRKLRHHLRSLYPDSEEKKPMR